MFDISKVELVQMRRRGRNRAMRKDAVLITLVNYGNEKRIRFNFSIDSLEKMGKPTKMQIALDERQSRLYFIPAEDDDRFAYKLTEDRTLWRHILTLTVDVTTHNSITQKIASIYGGMRYENIYADQTPSGQNVFYISKFGGKVEQ